MSSSVVAIVANIKRFRVPFYERLAQKLSTSGIDLNVVFSDPSAEEMSKKDSADLRAPLGVKVKGRYFLRDRLLLQFPPLRLVRSADLVIAVQANGYLINYL